MKTSRLKKGSVTFYVPVLTEHKYLAEIAENDKSLISCLLTPLKQLTRIMNQHREAVKLQSSDEDKTYRKISFYSAISRLLEDCKGRGNSPQAVSRRI